MNNGSAPFFSVYTWKWSGRPTMLASALTSSSSTTKHFIVHTLERRCFSFVLVSSAMNMSQDKRPTNMHPLKKITYLMPFEMAGHKMPSNRLSICRSQIWASQHTIRMKQNCCGFFFFCKNEFSLLGENERNGHILVVVVVVDYCYSPFLETSNSTKFSKFCMSDGSFWISLSLRPNFRRRCNRKKFCK